MSETLSVYPDVVIGAPETSETAVEKRDDKKKDYGVCTACEWRPSDGIECLGMTDCDASMCKDCGRGFLCESCCRHFTYCRVCKSVEIADNHVFCKLCRFNVCKDCAKCNCEASLAEGQDLSRKRRLHIGRAPRKTKVPEDPEEDNIFDEESESGIESEEEEPEESEAKEEEEEEDEEGDEDSQPRKQAKLE